MLSGHSVEDARHGAGQVGVTDFFARVDGSGACVPPELHVEVLDDGRALLLHFAHSEHLSVGALHLVVLTHELPELRLGHNVVGREAVVAEELGLRLVLSGLLAAHDLEKRK